MNNCPIHPDSNLLGIIDIQIYFPRYFISQAELEVYDKVPKGKYTIGLGQKNLSFVSDNEDINSICLTVLDMIIKKNNIQLSDIGRIEVGTETFIDKSKSIKTNLMDIFANSNCDIEGVTVSNACYGGTSALLNAFNWLYSSYYDGRYAIVICGDIAVYSKGPARPTGGAGAIAILLGKGGSIILDPIKASSMKNVYDFYKPNPALEYPVVDGHFSLQCYLEALWDCIRVYKQKGGWYNSSNIYGQVQDYFAFHCPYSKLVEKAFFEMKCIDILENKYKVSIEIKDAIQQVNGKFWELSRKIQDEIKNIFITDFNQKILPGLFLCKELGNLYTGSLFGFILSLIINESIDLTNKRIICFSYGSGYASTLFCLNIVSPCYKNIALQNKDIFTRLNNRIKSPPLEYEKILTKKEEYYLSNNYIPNSSVNNLFPETYYLKKVDDKWRRLYGKNAITNPSLSNNQPLQLSSNLCTSIWNGFHKKSILERQLQVKKVYPNVDLEKLKEGGITLLRADNMVENCIGILSIPLGLGLYFKINSKEYSVPMSTEEPSVIAAVSGAAKLIGENDGFFCFNDPPFMTTQIHYELPKDKTFSYEQIKSSVLSHKNQIISYGNINICPKMTQRGGGIVNIYTRQLKDNFFIIELIVNVCESMGANLLNQISEEMSKYLLSNNIIPFHPIMGVLSNLSIYRKTTSEFKINIKNLSYKNVSGEEIADRVIKAYKIALNDPFRASTHNKGIMNGIDAVALALGQDFRAIEASVHAYASLDPQTFEYSSYRPLTYYEIVTIKGDKYLYGSLTIPLAIGTVGGAFNSNECYRNNLNILNKPNASELGHIITSVGLAQNFAAIRALVSEGIQKGHIGLHAKNIAFRAGVPDYLIPDVVAFMKSNNSINEETALKYLESLKLYKEIRKKKGNDVNDKQKEKLSTFYINIDFDFLKKPICMNFLIKTNISPEINFVINSKKINCEDKRIDEIFKNLFGEGKPVEWLYEFMMFVHEMDMFSKTMKEMYQIKYKLKLIIILIFVLCGNLLRINHDLVSNFILEIINIRNPKTYDELCKMIPTSNGTSKISLEFGMTVLLELYEILNFYISNYIVVNLKIRARILNEIRKSIKNFIQISSFITESTTIDIKKFEAFFELRLTRLNAEVLILCDLGFNDEQYSDEDVDNFVSLGRYAAIKITLFRDLYKSKYTTHKYTNTFFVFSEMMKNMKIADPKIILNKYLKLKENEIEFLTKKILKIKKFKENGIDIIEKLEKRFKNYYQSRFPKSKL